MHSLNRSNFATKAEYVDANYADVLAFRTHRMFQQIADARNEQRAGEQQRELARRTLTLELKKIDRDERRFNASEPAEQSVTLLSADDLEREETEGRDSQMLIENLLPARGFCPLVGDSGLGKTSLMLQLAVCVATGTPFLGLPVRQGRVLINDHENQGKLTKTLRAVSRAIGKDYDTDVKPHLAFLQSVEAEGVFHTVDSHSFALVIVDALRGFSAGKEIDPAVMQPLITKMTSYNTCWLVCHHLRKEDRKSPPPPLEDLNVRVVQWLQEAAGSRAIVNQSFTRLAVIEPKNVEAALFIRGNVKGDGDVGPWHLQRIYDEYDEEPLGYKLADDWTLLNGEHREIFRAQVSGKTFSRSELKNLLGERKMRTFLSAAEPLGLFTKTGRQGQPDRRYVFKPYDYKTETADSAADILSSAE